MTKQQKGKKRKADYRFDLVMTKGDELFYLTRLTKQDVVAYRDAIQALLVEGDGAFLYDRRTHKVVDGYVRLFKNSSVAIPASKEDIAVVEKTMRKLYQNVKKKKKKER